MPVCKNNIKFAAVINYKPISVISMKRKTIYAAIALVSVAVTMMSFVKVESKKPKLAGTKWEFKREMFLTDVGTQTFTQTLEFLSKKEVKMTVTWFTPAHPEMRMRSDGTVGRVPASTNSSETKGTYKVKGKKITVTWDDGTKDEFQYEGTTILGPDAPFSKVE